MDVISEVSAGGRGRPAPDGTPGPPPDLWPFAPVGEPDDPAAELVDRLRARRSAAGVAAAYAAAHGHPGDLRGEDGGRRWALRGRTAVVAAVAVLLLGAGVAALALSGGIGSVDDVQGLAPAGAADVAGADAGAGLPDASSDETGPGAAGGGETAPAGEVVVHVVGQVNRPGLVTLPEGARIADAVEAAGGPTATADLSGVNLAREVADGEQLRVPAAGEVVAAPDSGGSGAPAAGGAAGDGIVDLNTADAALLDTLPGVGPVIAERIVTWRDENGPFTSVDELGEVDGIGPALLDKVRDSVRVR
ncbi:ComEA family DNA-binding protein [Antribacter sp. KLBMP9083]|uniref:ComEA family DNA-binding protein n=1 Tax=Antribacter soli TaxID=2910976 RepID=A0AA41QDQ2_9MICO|nr:ComEA family DNA-binding protein [Antribacter soli]MCF4121570.1 ComEA family DNA-binding protein [Antribacter soli]